MPNRNQLELLACELDALLPEGHRARLVWAYVTQANLDPIYAGIKAVESGPGRAAIAPEVLFALWLYATLEGLGSARALARATQSDDAYRWLCGGLQVNHHTLSDFRVDHGDTLDALLTASVAALLAAKAVKLKRVAQDGMRVRASAGAASFRRRGTLEAHLEDARQQVAALKAEIDADPAACSRQQQAARTRAAHEREKKIRQALARLPELEDIKVRQGKPPETARASTTDDQATVMKMADGGYRAAYNAEFATDTDSQVMVGIAVVTTGSDMAQLQPTVDQVAERYGQAPAEWLVDGGFPAHDQLDAVAARTTVYAPVPKPKDPADTSAWAQSRSWRGSTCTRGRSSNGWRIATAVESLLACCRSWMVTIRKTPLSVWCWIIIRPTSRRKPWLIWPRGRDDSSMCIPPNMARG